VTTASTPDNRLAVIRALEVLFREAPIARRQLRTALGSSPSTVTEVVHELLDRGLIVEGGALEPTAGRPAKVLELASELGLVLTADVGAMNMRFGAGTIGGRLITRQVTPTPSVKDQHVLQRGVMEGLEDVHRKAGAGQIRAVVLGIAAIVEDPYGGGLSMATVPGWQKTNSNQLIAWLREQFGEIPLMLENEANLAAIGEQRFGSAQGADDVMFVAVGAGVGVGLILGGSLYRGSRGAAGEIGLIRVATKYGIMELERAVGANALVSRYVEAGGATETVENIFLRAASAEPAASATISEVLDELALAMANAITLLDPARVVIGGGLAGAGRAFIDPLAERVAKLVDRMPTFVASELGADAALVGGVALASEHAQSTIISELQPTP
jgi:predicted NBD/HSP70 family sugar kinase